jgi:hypothetical protein
MGAFVFSGEYIMSYVLQAQQANPTFKIDVSRTYRNKEGYKAGAYRLNTSFETEIHTPETFLNNVIRRGWPYTMVHHKRSPEETGAAARGVSTPKHYENWLGRQELTGDDDSGAPGVIDFWLRDDWFKQYGFAFVESVNSKPGQAEKGHPTIIFDRPVIDLALYKECMKALAFKYYRLDPLSNADRTWFNAEGARVHKLGNICPWVVFERDILQPYRDHQAEQLGKRRAERKRQQAAYKEAQRTGRTDDGDDAIDDYIKATLEDTFNWLATRPRGRHAALYAAGVRVGRLRAAEWAPWVPFANIENEAIRATHANGYFNAYAHSDKEVLRTFNAGLSRGELDPAPRPRLYRTDKDKLANANEPPEPYRFEYKPHELSPEARDRRDEILAKRRPPRKLEDNPDLAAERLARSQARLATDYKLLDDGPPPEAEHDTCPDRDRVRRVTWSNMGAGETYFFCNGPCDCATCRQRHVLKLAWHLDNIANYAYIDAEGNAAIKLPERTSEGDFLAEPVGPGFWYGKILSYEERTAFNRRYRKARPGGFSHAEVYPILDEAGNNAYVALSLVPFEDLQPVKLSDNLKAKMAIGATGTRAQLLFGPPRKSLADAIPPLTFEMPKYLAKRGLITTTEAAHSVIFNKDVLEGDLDSDFDNHARSFDEIWMVLEEQALRTVDSERLRGLDKEPDYTIQTIEIVPAAKGLYLEIFNNPELARQHTRPNIPKMPKASSPLSPYSIKEYMDLVDNEPEPEPLDAGYYARIELMLRE